MRSPIALYPIVIAAGLVVELFVTSGVSPLVALRSLIVAVLAGAAFSAVGRLLLGDRHRGGVVATLAILLFIVGGDLRVALLLGLCIGLVFLERYGLPERRRLRWPFLSRFVSIVATILALAIGIQAVQAGTPGLVARALTEEAPFRPLTAAAAGAPSERPDVYFILVDGHARADVLREVLGHDPAPFEAGLDERGFDVASRSRSNYALTVQVLAAMFHMRPLHEIDAVRPLLDGTASQPAGSIIRRAINDSPVPARLRELGYELIAFASSYEEPALRSFDRWIDTGELNEFEVNMFRRTILRPLLAAFAPDLVASSYRSRVDNEFRQLAAIAAEDHDRPRFVFGHLPSPHAPWVRRADGSPRPIADVDAIFAETPASTGLDVETLKRDYAGQVAWLDGRLLEAIDEIDTASTEPPVIVIFGDHGTWIGSDGGDIRLRFLPLFASRFPDGSRPFPDDVELLDVFPTLFHNLFGDPLPPGAAADAPSYMFRGEEYDLRVVPDPNAAFPTAGVP